MSRCRETTARAGSRMFSGPHHHIIIIIVTTTNTTNMATTATSSTAAAAATTTQVFLISFEWNRTELGRNHPGIESNRVWAGACKRQARAEQQSGPCTA